jgi:hypothetical protein
VRHCGPLAPAPSIACVLVRSSTTSFTTGGLSNKIACWLYVVSSRGSTAGGKKDQSSLFSSLSTLRVSSELFAATLNACS